MRLSFSYNFLRTFALGILLLAWQYLPLAAQEGLPLAAQEASLLAAQEVDADSGDDDLWALDFKFQKLRMITPRRGPGKGRTYWYMVYTLENKTGEDREFFISITATSNRNKTYSDLFLPSVERDIERKEGREGHLWGKTDKYEILSQRDPEDDKYNYTTIRANEKDAEKRYCVAVFNKLDPNANKITIRVAGLSNDIEEVTSEVGSIEIRERVRELQFERIGDEYEITKDTFKLIGKRWIKKTLRIETSD